MDRIEALRAYCRIVERGTLTAAARDVRVKQSTVSKWLAALEDEVGAQLVDRTTRSLRVTEAGRRFHARAREIVEQYDAAVAEVAAGQLEPVGRVRVSAPVVFGGRHLVPLLPEFLEANPGIQLDLVFDDAYVDVVDGGFDVVLRVGVPVDSTLRARTLAPGRRRVVASPAYLARAGVPESPGALRDHACLVHRGSRAGAVWRFRQDAQEVTAPVGGGTFSANHSEALLALARAGHGVALLASWLVDDDLASGALVTLLTDWSLTPAPIRAVLPPGRYTPERVRRFVDFLAARLPQQVSPQPE